MPAMGTYKTLGPPYLKHMLPAYFLVIIGLLELQKRYLFPDCHFSPPVTRILSIFLFYGNRGNLNSQIKKLFEKGKSNGLAVNEIIASVFSIAFMENLNKKEIRLGVAANIRNELVSEPNNCMGNYATGISAKVSHVPENGFIPSVKTIAAILREQLSNQKTRHLVVYFLNEFDKDIIESIMFAAYGDFDHPVAKKLAELIGKQLEDKGLGISNLG
jgi:hypothetical protein